jgi:hypothetical protein
MSIGRIMGAAVLVTLVLAVTALAASCGGGGGIDAFCAIAETSSRERTETEIDEYHEQLEAAAPAEIKKDIAILRSGWNQFSFPFEQHLEGEITDISRPPEVTEAARNVSSFVEDKCGSKGGIYLILPEAGF